MKANPLFRHLLPLLLLAAFLLPLSACSDNGKKEVVIYTSVDQVFSEPLLEQFEQETGITVLPLYDTEASKTVGLVNRLVAEKDNPKADVFWNGEFVQTLYLKEEGVLDAYTPAGAADLPAHFSDPDGFWTAFGGRARILLVNTDLLMPEDYPRSILDLLDDRYIGEQIALAYPVFGTTATHAAALYAYWGEDAARTFYTSLRDKGVQIVDGNSVTRDMVADGRVAIGYTDTDDALSAILDGKPVAAVFPDQSGDEPGTLITPNTVARIAGGPNPEEAAVFIDWLLKDSTEQLLVDAGWIDIPSHDSVTGGYYTEQFGPVRGMTVALEDVYAQLETSKQDMQELFVR